MAQTLLLGFSLLGLYLMYIAVYRLFLNPLAKVPGPKLAALTRCYEMYYDLIKPALFPWKIMELHEKYGENVAPDISLTASDLAR